MTGKTPFQGAASMGDVMVSICSKEPPPIHGLAPWIPAEVNAIVKRALQKSPENRYQSCREMFDELAAVLGDGVTIRADKVVSLTEEQRRQIVARSIPPAIDVDFNTNVGPHVTEKPAVAALAPAARSRRGAIFLAALVVVGLGAGGFVLRARRSVAAAPATTPTEAAQKVTGRVKITPSTATVQVDGKPATLTDGFVVLVGTPGGSFSVVAKDGDRERATRVVLQLNGEPSVDAIDVAAPTPPASAAASGAPASSPPLAVSATSNRGPIRGAYTAVPSSPPPAKAPAAQAAAPKSQPKSNIKVDTNFE